MKVRFFGSTMLAVLGWQTASAVEVSWYRQPGSAKAIASNASASVWAIGTDDNLYKWDGKQFVNQKHNYPAASIAVTITDKFWLVDQIGLRAAEGLNGLAFYLPTKARDVAVGGDNSAWIIGTDARPGGYGVYQHTSSNSFSYANFGAVDIAVDKTGNAWVVNDTGEIHRYNLASKAWELIPAVSSGAKARSIHAGGSSGTVWILTKQSTPGGFPIYQWNSSTSAWEGYGSIGAVDITEAAGVPWIVQSDGRLYSKAQPATTPSAPVNVTQTWPTPTPQLSQPARALDKGKLLCTTTGSTNDCQTDTKADYVGKYDYNESLTCDNGFFDPIYGGSCWKCPDDDGSGGWIRSLTAVDSDTACWRAPKESLGYATKVKSPAWSWECPSGSFWDGYSPDGAGGSCWTCPADLPRRTGFAVWAHNACASSLNQTKKAIFLEYKGCPKPDAETMALPGKRTPGRAFLDVAAGATQSSSAGVCFACPITDSDGNFLITSCNGNSLYDKDNNTGCAIKMKWTPAAFYEPGLAYMQGVKELIWEQKLFDGALITGFLYDLAETKSLGDATPEATEWVKQQWQEILTNPYNNAQFRAYVFVLLKNALKKEATTRTSAEKRLIKSFAEYIRQRNTYLAEQALAMYDAWKLSDDQFRARTGQNRQLSSFFYYGTVPLDFHGMLSGLMGLGASGGGVLGALVSTNKWTQGITFIKDAEFPGKLVPNYRTLMHGITGSLRALRTIQGLTAVSGAAIIEVVSVILGSIAMDQFEAIETARPKLLASLEEAKEPVDLDVLSALTNGEDMMYLYWARAMETWDTEDPQVLQLAAMAQLRAEQSGYAAPPKAYRIDPTAGKDTLSSGTTTSGDLNQGEKITSKNGKYEAEMQADGNFVIYAPNRQPIWATGTNGKGSAPYKLAMQTDGHLVIYGSNGFVWGSGVVAGTAPYKLVMQDDANLVIYDSANRFIWNSGTYRAP